MTDKIFVPPIKIQGIKTKLVPTIRKNVVMNRDSVWIEPFMGSGVVGFNVQPERAIFADINPHLISFYTAIKEKVITPYTVRAFLEYEGQLLARYDDEHYYAVRSRFNESHDPLDFLFLNRACFNGMIRYNKDNAFNVPYGHKPQRFSKAYITKIVNQVDHVAKLLQQNDWTFLCQTFEDTIHMATPDDFIYCDPPYIGRHVDYYDRWDEQSEIALREALFRSKAHFMLSTWDHNEYRKNAYLSTVWASCHEITHEHYYFVGALESNRRPVVEALLTNYVSTGDRNDLLKARAPLTLFTQVEAI